MTDINIDDAPGGEAKPREGLAEAAGAVKAEAAHFAAATGEKAQEKLAQGQAAVGGGIRQFADALRQAGANLDQQDQSLVSGLVKQAADGLESAARVVADKRPDEMLRAVRDFGRANPTALIAASVLAGLALGRLARASGEHAGGDDAAPWADTSSVPSEVGQASTENPGQDDLGAGVGAAWAGAQSGTQDAAPSDTALADTESLSVLGDPGDVEAEDESLGGGRRSGLSDDREV